MAPLRNLTYSDSMQIESNASIISIVDDDAGVREAISSLVRSAGFRAAVFPSVGEFLAAQDTKDAKCLILDVRMPQMSGLELQAYLETTARRIPIIFATGYPDAAEQKKALDHGRGVFAQAFRRRCPVCGDAPRFRRNRRFGVSAASLSPPAKRAVDV